MGENKFARKLYAGFALLILVMSVFSGAIPATSMDAKSNGLTIDEDSAARNMKFNEDKGLKTLIKSLSPGYHANNTYLDVYFGETHSDTWYFQYEPGTWGDACYTEHYAVWTGNWSSTKESDEDFTVDQYFDDSADGRTATLHYGDLKINRQIYVPSGDAKYFTITYTLTNTNETASLSDVRFFEAVDYDIVDSSGDYGWYVDTDDSIWQNDDRYFKNGFTGDKASSNHGMDYWDTELYYDWDDGELNGKDKYPETGTDDVAVGMQWNIGNLSSGESWQIVLTLVVFHHQLKFTSSRYNFNLTLYKS